MLVLQKQKQVNKDELMPDFFCDRDITWNVQHITLHCLFLQHLNECFRCTICAYRLWNLNSILKKFFIFELHTFLFSLLMKFSTIRLALKVSHFISYKYPCRYVRICTDVNVFDKVCPGAPVLFALDIVLNKYNNFWCISSCIIMI